MSVIARGESPVFVSERLEGSDLSVGNFVNYGCGLTAPRSWRNFDASPRLRLERISIFNLILRNTIGLTFPQNVTFGDVTKRLPLNDNSVDCVYCSHVLEHLSSEDVNRALTETIRILKPGGVFRLVVPDLYWRASVYINSADANDEAASDNFMWQTLLGERTRDRGCIAIVKGYLGNSAHRWMFDFAGLSARLTASGFISIHRCAFGDSFHPAFKEVEQRDRFFEGEHTELSIEARKPCSL